MIDNFIKWFHQHYTEITWFIIGWLTLNALYDFGRGDWIGFIIDAILITVNYKIWRR
jgi:hypothetical protein